MPSIYQLKPAFQNLLRPIAQGLATRGVTANQVTVAAVVLSAVVGVVLLVCAESRAVWLLMPAVMICRMGLNAIDGMLAREHNMKSDLGAILNELGDVVSDSLLFLPLCYLPGVSAPLVVIFVLLAALSEMTGVIAVQIGAERRYDGPMGKSDRAAIVSILSIIWAAGASLTVWANIAFAVLCLLICWTIRNRALQALRQVSAPRNTGVEGASPS